MRYVLKYNFLTFISNYRCQRYIMTSPYLSCILGLLFVIKINLKIHTLFMSRFIVYSLLILFELTFIFIEDTFGERLKY